jgi:hypothetical protein
MLGFRTRVLRPLTLRSVIGFLCTVINFHFIACSNSRCMNALRCNFVFLLAGRGGLPGIDLPAMSFPFAIRLGITMSGVPRVSKAFTQSSII